MIPKASKEDRHVILDEWNRMPPPAEEKGFLFHEFLEWHAAKTPHAPAVIYGKQTVTYHELNARANRLAHHLQALGTGPNVLVGIFMNRSPELAEAVFATLKAGGACLPLDPETPPERLQLLLNEAHVHVVLTVEALANRLPDILTLRLDGDQEAIKQHPSTPPVSSVDTHHLSRIFFTSGSTGTPKGVMWRHNRVPARGGWFQQTFNVTASDRFLMKASLAFTPINLEIFQPVMAGATIYIAAPGAERDPAKILDHISNYQITFLNTVPTMLRLLLEEKEWRRCRCLRHVICFGEALPPELEGEFFEKSAAVLSVIYGATEAPSSTFRRCIPGQPPRGVNIGRRIGNKQVLVLNEEMDLAPIGVAGEICISGDNLALGYLNAPELTARKFLPNPFASPPGARMYRTGDRGRYLPDGSIEFLGRTDDQVKIRGFRVELGEVEAVLRRHPLVHDAVTVAQTDASGAQSLIACLVGPQEDALDAVRHFARANLPGYMVPSFWTCLETLPLTATGKIDRKALPLPGATAPKTSSRASEAPRTPLEAKIARLWRETLGMGTVGRNDHFFDIGGHSLLGIRLVATIRSEICAGFSVPHLIEAPTVARQANLLERLLAAPFKTETPWQCLVKIWPGEPSHPPLFLVPGGGGGEKEFLVYGRFLRHLGGGWPVYGFCARGMDGRQLPHNRVDTMARDYLREMQKRQPHGPYFIAGECIGGIVAYELARQLREKGEPVAFLALLDTQKPTSRLYAHALAITARKRISEFRDKIRQAPWYKRPRIFCKQGARLWKLMSDQWGWIGTNPFPDREDARVSYVKRVRNAYSRTALRYQPQPYPGNAVFFSSQENESQNYAEDWRPLIEGTLECHGLEGDHFTYLRDHGKTAGELFGACLQKSMTRPEHDDSTKLHPQA